MIARRLLREDAWKVVAYTAILTLNLAATIAAYPTFEANFKLIMNLIPGFLDTLKRAVFDAGAGGLPAFLAINHLFKGANVMGAAMAIVLALGTIVREVEIGTVHLLLSRPVSRTRVLLSFFVIHAIELALPLFLVSALAAPLSEWMIGRHVPLAPLMIGAAHASLFVISIYAVALLLSVCLSEQIKVAAGAGGLCVVSFVLYFIDATRPFTLYRLSAMELYSGIAGGSGFPWRTAGAVSLLLAMALLLAHAVFTRRDY